MAAKSFASSADLGVKEQTLEVLADGVYALTAEGDPNLGAIEGEDFLVCFEALATPVAARHGTAARQFQPGFRSRGQGNARGHDASRSPWNRPRTMRTCRRRGKRGRPRAYTWILSIHPVTPDLFRSRSDTASWHGR